MKKLIQSLKADDVIVLGGVHYRVDEVAEPAHPANAVAIKAISGDFTLKFTAPRGNLVEVTTKSD